jgi:hypothetical protein
MFRYIMKDVIRKLLKEAINELGTANAVPLSNISVDTELESVEQGLPVLHEIYYSFSLDNEEIMCRFELADYKEQDNLVLFTYNFDFTTNRSFESVNNIKTMFIKMMTFKDILMSFINKFTKEYEVTSYRNKKSMLYEIKILGMANKDKGEAVAGDETQRTKLYDYFIKKFILPDFSYVKEGNILILRKKLT